MPALVEAEFACSSTAWVCKYEHRYCYDDDDNDDDDGDVKDVVDDHDEGYGLLVKGSLQRLRAFEASGFGFLNTSDFVQLSNLSKRKLPPQSIP